MPSMMTGTRLDENTDQLVTASAERRGMTRSDWLRLAVISAIEAEELAAEQAPTLAGMGKQLEALEMGLRENLDVAKRTLSVIADLSNTIAVETAADRAVARQIYRMACRSGYLVVRRFTDQVPEEERDALAAMLCAEADDLIMDAGLKRLDDEMRIARMEVAENVDRLTTS